MDLNLGTVDVFAEAQAEIMGDWNSAPMVAFGTLRRLSAWKMYCRANDVPFDVANDLSDRLKRYESDLKYADDDDKDEIDVFDYIPAEYHEYVKMSERYLGMVDNISQHPCAYLLCQEDIRREIGIFRINSKTGKKKTIYAAFIDGATAEAYGYLKNDLLSVDVVSINREVFRGISKPQPTVKELLALTDGDKETWRMYKDGLTMGLNQVEKDKTREKVMQYKPTNITELSAFVAAVRPGFKSMLPMFLNREHFEYGIPAFDKLIQTREMTSSWVLYQEQTMKTLQYAGFTAPESYSAIKAIAKKHPEKVLPLKDRFLEGFEAKILADDAGCTQAQAKEMALKVWQIIEDTTQYSYNASHSVCVALDSLYGAYAKSHYPYEYYTTLLSLYSEKADKDRIAKVKQEMKKGFGITVAPCRFRQDNRGFYIDRDNNQISDALSSIKHISKKVAVELYRMRDNQYAYFTDLLYDLEMNPAFDARIVTILIRLGYFQEFGSTGKLLNIQDAFRNGENKFSKSHIEKTRMKRLVLLREQEDSFPDEEIGFEERIQHEITYYGTPLSVFSEQKGHFAVLDVDEKYSPKVRLYNIAAGTVGIMKIRKATYKWRPLQPGDVITLLSWQKKPAYHYSNGKPTVRPGVFDLWLEEYVYKRKVDKETA